MTSHDICAKHNLLYGFDGPMYALEWHVDSYNPRRYDPVHYGGTQNVISEISEISKLCLPLLKK